MCGFERDGGMSITHHLCRTADIDGDAGDILTGEDVAGEEDFQGEGTAVLVQVYIDYLCLYQMID